eukprot:8274588-Alexandrium_andersonii.AAC.1
MGAPAGLAQADPPMGASTEAARTRRQPLRKRGGPTKSEQKPAWSPSEHVRALVRAPGIPH